MNPAQQILLERIDQISTALPHLRIGQLLHLVTGGADLFDISDEYLLNLLDEYIAKNHL